MKSFLKLFFAAVTAALLVMGSAYAGPVENSNDSKVQVGGIVWAGIGYVTPFEDASGETPTSTFDVNNETRLNVSWGNDQFTGHWEYWMRNDVGRNVNGLADAPLNNADGDLIMGWLDWNPTSEVQLSVGQLEDRSWMQRAVDWEIHNGTVYMPGATPGAFKAFPENQPGLDVSYNAGGIKAGLAVYAAGVVTGAANDQSSGVATTYIPHVEYTDDLMWIGVVYNSESASAAAATEDADGNTTYDWSSTTDTTDTAIIVSTKFNVGVGKASLQYISIDGDSYEDAQTDIAAAFIFNIGDDAASIEYDTFDPGGDADAQTWLRVGYQIAMAANSGMRVSYAMADDGNSSSSRPAVTWWTSF